MILQFNSEPRFRKFRQIVRTRLEGVEPENVAAGIEIGEQLLIDGESFHRALEQAEYVALLQSIDTGNRVDRARYRGRLIRVIPRGWPRKPSGDNDQPPLPPAA